MTAQLRPEDVQADRTSDLREYLGILRARKWTIILITVATVAAALSLSYRQTPLYTSTARVLVNPITSDPQSSVPQTVDIATESQLLASEPVAAMVKEDLGLDTPSTLLLQGLEVTPVSSGTVTRVLEVTYTSADPQRAQQVANAFANDYLRYRRERALEELRALQQTVQDQITKASDDLAKITRQLQGAQRARNQSLAVTLQSSQNTISARLGVLQQQLSELQPNESVIGGGDVIESAKLASAPSSPNYVKNTLLALFLGLALGIGVAFLKERLDDRFRGRADIEADIKAPVLATVPTFERGKRTRKRSASLITISDPKGAASEAYRSLRTNLQFQMMQRDLHSVLITSPSAGEGKSVTSANLAVALAGAGRRVVLISADLRRPTVESYFDLEDKGPGLTGWLLAETDHLWSLIKDPGIPNLRVIPSGAVPANPAELLTSPRLREMIENLERNSDVVIFDTPPALPVADASIVAPLVDATILVVDAASTHRSATMRAKQELERAGGLLIGAVLNGFDPSSSPYSYYESRYYAAEYPSTPTASSRDRIREGELSSTAQETNGARGRFRSFRR